MDILKDFVDLTISRINLNESLMILGMPEFGKSKILLPNLMKELSKQKRSTFILSGYINGDKKLLSISDGQNQHIIDLPFDEVYFKIKDYIKLETGTTLIIYSLEKTDLDIELINLCKRYRNQFNINWIFIGYTNVYNKLIQSDVNQTLSSSKLIVKPLSKDLAQKYIEYLEKEFNLRIDDKDKNTIINISGGSPGLIKGMIRNLVNKERFDILSTNLKSRIKHIIAGMDGNQLDTYIKICEKKSVMENSEVSFLRDFGYIDQFGNPFSPLLSDYLLENFSRNDFQKTDLTLIEERILNYFTDNKNKIITRDDIALLIWGHDRVNKYSDYTIDKYISNIRIKTKNLKNKLQIETLKKRGYIAS